MAIVSASHITVVCPQVMTDVEGSTQLWKVQTIEHAKRAALYLA
jgi:hypothetical protein